MKLGLNPYGLAYTVGLQGLALPARIRLRSG